jgi:hypothetical protein
LGGQTREGKGERKRERDDGMDWEREEGGRRGKWKGIVGRWMCGKMGDGLEVGDMIGMD